MRRTIEQMYEKGGCRRSASLARSQTRSFLFIILQCPLTLLLVLSNAHVVFSVF